jgi:glucose-1-phosphate thymidylyltransferase
MKVIIPVAGTGSLLRPHTNTQPKPLIPVAGMPILGHIVRTLREAGFDEFIFVIGYLGDKIEEYIQSNFKNLIEYEFVLQQPREGLAHAIWSARNSFRNEKEILIVLGDTIAETDFSALKNLEGSWLGVKKVDNPKDFGIAVIHKNNHIKSLVEKPKIPVSNEALVGIYKISEVPLLLECIEDLFFQKRITNNEYHLTDALMKMIEKGVSLRTFDVSRWFDCGKKDALLAANAILLNYPENQSDIEICYDGNIILQPVRIGKNCRIKNSIIGPNVAVGENTAIDSCIIKESIVGSYSELRNVVMYQSIIGSDAKITGICQSLNIGDNTEINLSN